MSTIAARPDPESDPRVRAVFDDIRATRKSDFINAFWRYIAFDAELLESSTTGGRLILLKPQTYMNRSGTAVSQAMRWYKVRLEDLLVVCDDLDLPFGRLRLRPQGSSGGHNGLKSIIEQIGSDRFPRLRVGVGRPIRGDAVAHVLNRFSPDEEAALPAIIERAADAVMTWHAEGITAAMNQFNQPPASRPSAT